MQNQMRYTKKKEKSFKDCNYLEEFIDKEIKGLGINEYHNGNKYKGKLIYSDKNGISCTI